MSDFIWQSLVIGAGGTAAMDIWAIILHRVFAMPLPNWGLVGRWFAHLPSGKVFHDDITVAPMVSNETAIGWISHYVIGIIYAGALIWWMGQGWVENPTFLPAWLVGMITIGAGWFILAPGMGAGWAASRRPNPMQIRALNIIAHSIFAFGMFGSAVFLTKF